MRQKRNWSRWLVLPLAVVSLAVTGCVAETPTEPDDGLQAVGRLGLFLTGDSADTSPAARDFSSFAPTAQSLSKPSVGDIEVAWPGTPGVMSWPVVQDLPIHPRRRGGSIHLAWPSVDTNTWPGFSGAGPSDDLHFGNAWMVYRTGNRWVAETVEWLRGHERDGTVFDPGEKLTVGQPRNDEPVAFFIAGPSRHSPNRPRYRRRSTLQWYEWGSLGQWVWEEDEDGGGDGGDDGDDDGPDPEPGELEEVHVWITGLETELENGTRLSFNEEVGDVELLSLDGKTVQVVDVEIPIGTYEYVAFRLDEARSYVVEGGSQKPLSIPSEDVRVMGPFAVDPGAMTSVTLHFDTDASLTQGNDGSWSLNPVVDITVSGS